MLVPIVTGLFVAMFAERPAYKQPAGVDDAVARIVELGGSVRRVSMVDDSLEVDFQHAETGPSDDHLQYLLALPNVVAVRLKAAPVTDAGMVHIGKIATLRRLHLEKTNITDAGVRELAGLKELEYLNLYGTKVGDAGVAHLKSLPKLRQLFVWQTQVTGPAIAALKKELPNLRVVPDPAADRARATASWESTKAALAEARSALAAAEKDAADNAGSVAESKKELDSAVRASNEAKKLADAAKKKSDDAARRAGEPGATADAKKLADDAKKQSDELQSQAQKAAANVESLRQRSAKAAGYKQKVDDAKIALEGALAQEESARKRLAEIE